MRRMLSVILLCAGASLAAPALADNTCLADSADPSDPAVSFPDASYDYIFALKSVTGGYISCYYSPSTLDMRTFTGSSAADLNHDGWGDLVFGVKGSGGGQVQVFLNDKTGSGIVVLHATLSTGATHAPVLVGTPDLNGDGRPDILTDNGSDGTFSVMLNDGTGAFPTLRLYAAGADITQMAVMDVNGDGHPDVIAVDYVGNAVAVFTNTGTGAFATAVAIPVGTAPYSMQVGDLDGDGSPDIVTENIQDKTVSVLLNNGDGTYATQVAYPTAHPSFVSLIDVNNDGHPDIVTDFTNGAWYALVNNGDGTFATAAWVAMPGGSGGGVGISTGGGGVTLIGGSTTPITGTNYSSGSGKVTPPTTPSGTPPATGGMGSASDAGGGGGMEWLSLMLLGIAGLLRRKRA